MVLVIAGDLLPKDKICFVSTADGRIPVGTCMFDKENRLKMRDCIFFQSKTKPRLKRARFYRDLVSQVSLILVGLTIKC
jgi:hypothetical protein